MGGIYSYDASYDIFYILFSLAIIPDHRLPNTDFVFTYSFSASIFNFFKSIMILLLNHAFFLLFLIFLLFLLLFIYFISNDIYNFGSNSFKLSKRSINNIITCLWKVISIKPTTFLSFFSISNSIFQIIC